MRSGDESISKLRALPLRVEGAEMAGYLRELPLRSLDRVTKIGQALDFGHVWDGYNLLTSFTRQIPVHL